MAARTQRPARRIRTPDSAELRLLARVKLPQSLKPFFWDVDFKTLSWARHREFIIQRILESGDWKAVKWVWNLAGDAGLKQYVLQQKGRGLCPSQITFWSLMLRIPARTFNPWLKERSKNPWERRQFEAV